MGQPAYLPPAYQKFLQWPCCFSLFVPSSHWVDAVFHSVLQFSTQWHFELAGILFCWWNALGPGGMWRCYSLISRNGLQLFQALLWKDPVPTPHFSSLAIIISSYSYLNNILWNDSSIYSVSHLSFLAAFWRRCWGRCSAAVKLPMDRELRALCTSSWEKPSQGLSPYTELLI